MARRMQFVSFVLRVDYKKVKPVEGDEKRETSLAAFLLTSRRQAAALFEEGRLEEAERLLGSIQKIFVLASLFPSIVHNPGGFHD